MDNHIYIKTSLERSEKSVQLAFLLDECYNLIVSKSGHGAIMRDQGLHKGEVLGGGWIWLNTGKLTNMSGLVGYIPITLKPDVADSLSLYFGRILRFV